MVGSQGSTRKTSRALIALLALLALVATACGGADSTEAAVDQVDAAETAVDDSSTSADETTSSEPEMVDAGEETDGAADDNPVDDETVADDVVDTVDDPEDVDTPDEAVNDDASKDSALKESTDADSPLAQVLAFALEASETQSYSFTQGMAMRMNVAGMQLDIAPSEAYVFGEVEGNKTHMRADIGVIMAATFESMGIDVNQAPFNEIFADLGGAGMEMWTDESTVILDMSELASFMGGLDPAAGAELDAFANGPVKIDLTQLDGVDATTLANEFGQGAQVTDPGQILQALRDVDAVTETGTDSINGVAVRVFSAELSMADYYTALDVDIEEQLAAANLGELGGADALLGEALLPAIQDLKVNLVVMIDDQDLVRRMETSIDMGAMMQAMFDNPEVLDAIAAEDGQSTEDLQDDMELMLGGGIEMIVDTWQEFDNYGEAFGILLPDAVDVTSEIPEALAG